MIVTVNDVTRSQFKYSKESVANQQIYFYINKSLVTEHNFAKLSSFKVSMFFFSAFS